MAGTHPTVSSCDSGEQGVLRYSKRLNRHVAGDGGELAQEFVESVAAFEVVDEVLEGDARASEAGDAVEDLLVGNDDRLAHACRIAVGGACGAGGSERKAGVLWKWGEDGYASRDYNTFGAAVA